MLRADSTGAGNGGTLILNNGTATERINGTATERINWLNSTGTVTVFYNPASYTTPTDFTVGNGRIGVASPGQLTSFMLVNTFANLQNIVDPGGNPALNRYALGTDIDANGGTLNPFTFTFQGIFEGKDAVTGQNDVISNVNVAGPAPLGFNSGTFRNFTLANWTVNATANNQFVGLLVGQNTSTGKIENVIVSGGNVNGGNFTGIVAGGMVGQNAGDNRFVRWAAKGVWVDIFDILAAAAGPPAQILIDSSAVKAHRCASGGKGGSKIRRSADRAAGAPPKSTP